MKPYRKLMACKKDELVLCMISVFVYELDSFTTCNESKIFIIKYTKLRSKSNKNGTKKLKKEGGEKSNRWQAQYVENVFLSLSLSLSLSL